MYKKTLQKRYCRPDTYTYENQGIIFTNLENGMAKYVRLVLLLLLIQLGGFINHMRACIQNNKTFSVSISFNLKNGQNYVFIN